MGTRLTDDPSGGLTSASESLPNANGWVNPYRFDGRDGVRSDAADGLDGDYNKVAAGMIGATVITAAWTALFTLMSPDFAVLWIGLAVAAIAMIGIRLE